MTDPEQPTKEFRLKGGDHILGYIRRFSATEKVIFGALVILALISSAGLTLKVSDSFLVNVPAHGGELREGEVGLPRSINPLIAVTDADRDLVSLVYAGLTRYSNGILVPDIARSWTVSADGLTYDFILKDGVKFQDGAPLTADDVAFTIEKIQDPALKSPRQADWANITVKEVSPTEIQFILKQPYSPFIANTTVGIMPKHIWGAVGDGQFIFSQYNLEPVGAGPYAIGSIVRDSGGIPTIYDLVPTKSYYGDAPFIGTISFHFFPDENKALSALDAGEIDSLPSVSPAEAARLASNSAQNYEVLSASLPRIFGVFFNQSQAPVLADLTVRKALDLSTDRAAIVAAVLSGYGTPVSGPLPIGMGTSTPPQNGPDIAAAKALLEKNGWKKNAAGIYEKKASKPKTASTTLSFDIYTADSPDLVTAANMLKAQWARIGADVGVQVFEQADLYQNVIRTRKYDALLFGEQVGKDRDLYAFWHSSQRNSPGLNVALYANSKVDAVLADIRTTNDASARAADYGKLDQLIRADIPAIFLYSPDFIYAVPKSLQGMSLGSVTTAADRWSSVGSWYVETESVWKIFTKK